MKFTVEKKDIKEVISIAKDYYGVGVSEEKAKQLVQSNSNLAEELVHGRLDTVGRSVLADAIVQDVFKNVTCKTNSKNACDPTGNHWEWPLYGSSQEYKDTFDREFKANAPKRGYKLLECWDK